MLLENSNHRREQCVRKLVKNATGYEQTAQSSRQQQRVSYQHKWVDMTPEAHSQMPL